MGRARETRRNKRIKGFTLLELLVVLAILGMLAALVGPQVLNQLGGAKSKSAAIQKALLRSVERYSDSIHQINHARCPVGHLFDRRLVVKEIAAVNRVIKVFPFAIAQLSRLVIAAVDSTLSAHAMRSLHRNKADHIDGYAEFGQLH